MPIDGPLMAIDGPHGTAMAIDELRWDLSTGRAFKQLDNSQIKQGNTEQFRRNFKRAVNSPICAPLRFKREKILIVRKDTIAGVSSKLQCQDIHEFIRIRLENNFFFNWKQQKTRTFWKRHNKAKKLKTKPIKIAKRFFQAETF